MPSLGDLGRIATRLLAAAFGLAVCLVIIVCALWRHFEPTGLSRLPDSVSTAGIGRAAFICDDGSFAGKSVWTYARDPARIQGKPIVIGGPYASDGNVKMVRAVWSGDGTLVAVRARVGESAGHGFAHFDGEFYVSAYDFREHHAVTGDSTYRTRSKRIDALFAKRGGDGNIALMSPYAADGKPMDDAEAQDYPR